MLYVDSENSLQDINQRIRAMGHDPTGLDNLRYLLHQPLPPLDTPAGGRDLAGLTAFHRADLVVLDTLATLTEGPEDKADTYRALARHTMLRLKAKGCSVLRLDHTGHNGTEARGSSAKAADVDATWHLKASGNSVTLTLNSQRSGCHPETIALRREVKPSLRHVPVEVDKVTECAAVLDELGVDISAGRDTAGPVLRANHYKYSNEVISKALKSRRLSAGERTGQVRDS